MIMVNSHIKYQESQIRLNEDLTSPQRAQSSQRFYELEFIVEFAENNIQKCAKVRSYYGLCNNPSDKEVKS